ncbi:MAG: peptidylprolyl isomerase [Candidatus Methanosuratincola sp.]|jgi:peptidylprolyl isomerase|uniref:peptidylprolyl isomerase n=1 Tax=Methanosuratincola subterraneus TaxID=2593994 RepID=A0A444L6B2_METS7|nr:peptidylprolyl isomerase [Candidatus Methanosuratincola sp.]RWX73129.1 MAG: peptidylprolyl isomerase [Candidatus Methanosuratincola subterraneus]
MAIKSGDFVLIDYILKVKDTGEIFDITMEDQAKANNAYAPDQIYEPRLVAVGQGWTIKGIDEALVGMEEGAEKEFEIPPEKAFGERDPAKVRIVPARDLTRQGVTPKAGARIEVGGSLATIRSVGSGRVTIDFNHPLAGRALLAKLYVRKVVEDQAEKIRELIHRRVRNVPKEKFIITSIGSAITIEMPEESFVLEDIQFAKKGLAREISKYFPDVTSVQFIETYVLKTPKAEAAAEPAKEAEATQAGAAEEPKASEGETKKE